mmetsp:Transcript_58130/g.142613  ORF Transcript_58130/g.142613 Transcript_58130/m.142613 type:complete len:285 (-) Transcript_58130:244-1098(-)
MMTTLDPVTTTRFMGALSHTPPISVVATIDPLMARHLMTESVYFIARATRMPPAAPSVATIIVTHENPLKSDSPRASIRPMGRYAQPESTASCTLRSHTVCGVSWFFSTFSKYTLTAPERVISRRTAARPTVNETMPMSSVTGPKLTGLLSLQMSTAPITTSVSARHLRTCSVRFMIKRPKSAVVRILACPITVKSPASMRCSDTKLSRFIAQYTPAGTAIGSEVLISQDNLSPSGPMGEPEAFGSPLMMASETANFMNSPTRRIVDGMLFSFSTPCEYRRSSE